MLLCIHFMLPTHGGNRVAVSYGTFARFRKRCPFSRCFHVMIFWFYGKKNQVDCYMQENCHNKCANLGYCNIVLLYSAQPTQLCMVALGYKKLFAISHTGYQM